MKKNILYLFSIIILLGLTGCGNITENKTLENTTQQENTTSQKDVKEKEIIYTDDDGINLFINKYNENYSPKITSDMLHKKHIGGRDRDDVVVVSNDKLEIIIYNNYSTKEKYNMSVYVGYLAKNLTSEDYKEYFVRYVKLFDDTLSNEDIDNYWDDMISSYHSSYKINDIDISTSTNNGTIQYFKLTKNIIL